MERGAKAFLIPFAALGKRNASNFNCAQKIFEYLFKQKRLSRL